MDTNIDDRTYHQIEKNLSDHMEDDLFTTGRIFDHDNKSVMGNSLFQTADYNKEEAGNSDQNEWNVQNNMQSALPRAEYIRQAREACLRQMSVQSTFRNYEPYVMDSEDTSFETAGEKRLKSKPLKLFHDSNQESEIEKTTSKTKTVNTQKEIEDFRSLIIRIIFAFVLFLSIFVIDKFNLQIGKVTPKTVEEYVTGNDSLQGIEDTIVSWLK